MLIVVFVFCIKDVPVVVLAIPAGITHTTTAAVMDPMEVVVVDTTRALVLEATMGVHTLREIMVLHRRIGGVSVSKKKHFQVNLCDKTPWRIPDPPLLDDSCSIFLLLLIESCGKFKKITLLFYTYSLPPDKI